MKLAVTYFTALLLTPLMVLHAADGFLVEQGQSRGEIVVAETPPRAVKLAAVELQSYLEKITGSRLEIVTSPTDAMPVKIYVGESEYARRAGVNAEDLGRDAFRLVSGPDWLALVGRDWDFTPVEPWARSHTDWLNNKQADWMTLAGHPWQNPVAASLYKNYSKQLDIWNFDHRGSLNAVYAFLGDLGVRWYMPGELGEIVPKSNTIALPEVNRVVSPKFEVRSVSRPLISSSEVDDALWYLRLGANEQYGILHHGQRNLTEHPDQRARHPEYYVLLPNGKRDTESKKANACLSSPGLFQETVAYARLMFDHYDMPIVSVMPHDGFNHCQCNECKGQATIDRGPSGLASDYVWKFVVRVANELAKSHPDRKVFCGAYSTYRLPPLSIDRLPDNVWVQITNGRPIRELDNETHNDAAELRRSWQAKTRNPLSLTLNYTPFTNRGAYRPQYWPHVIARGLRDTSGKVWREDVWLSSGMGGLHHPGMSHLNPYVISRLWWDADQDVDGLLDEYYHLFYGSAAAEMKAFIEYCETNYARLGSDGGAVGEAIRLFDQAKAATAPESVYGRRIALVEEFLITLRNRASQMSIPRPAGLPQFRVIDMGKDKWRDARDTLVIDGKIDEPFWNGYSLRGNLKDSDTGKKPRYPTHFRVRWWNDNLYFAIHCTGELGVPPNIGGSRDGDPAIWNGEHLELLIETDKHSYYQIVVNPDGSITCLDRGADKKNWFNWSAQAEVATHHGDDFWSVELKLPVASSDEDPLHQLVGNMPFKSKTSSLDSGKGTSLPWYFNLFRKRVGSDDGETTAFSPIGSEAKAIDDTQMFGEIFVQ
ncbi:DUF4838 domain-containing protein [Neorhodopirellula pilleata]|uniref:Carbohydrate-binding domain-containing protein n=1 Tax=Neorhodopirellula pilleata TaxID=2714738 RepID=A0A5C6A4Y9_9BACT|nr:DUF4838 domain-containing protein [Neorhodopirellula pilleata]TWT94984.1 hypothetical protein Pla100_35630 [Neorhodopirellula pilleata]